MWDYTRAMWNAAPPKEPLTPFKYVTSITVHWEGVDAGTGPSEVRAVQAYHMSHNYIDIAYNAVIDLNGDIYEGRGTRFKSGANGTTEANNHSYAVCVLMGPGQHLSDAAKAALVSHLHEVVYELPFAGQEIFPHKRWFNTACPGPELEAFIKTIPTPITAGDTPPPSQGADVPRVKPVADAVGPVYVSDYGAWEAFADGSVHTLEGQYHGNIRNVPPALRKAVVPGTYCTGIGPRVKQGEGYMLKWSNGDTRFEFGPGSGIDPKKLYPAPAL